MLEFKLESEYQALATVQDKEQDALLAKGNVVGVALGHKIKGGIDTGDPCVSVLVNQKMLDDSLLLPEDKIAPTVGTRQLTGIRHQTPPIVSYAVANNWMPLTDKDCIAFVHQELSHIVKVVAQRQCFPILKLALDCRGPHSLPWEPIQHHKVIPFRVSL